LDGAAEFGDGLVELALALPAHAEVVVGRRTWVRDLARLLGEAEEPETAAVATQRRLEQTSLLETRGGDRFDLHPATVQYIEGHFPPEESFRRATHRRVGAYLEAEAKTSPYLDVVLEAGYHLFEAGEYDRANELLGGASGWLQSRGRVREGLSILEPFLEGAACQGMKRELVGQLHGTVGLAYAHLGQPEKAIGYYEQVLIISRDIQDRRSEGSALGNLGVAYFRLGQTGKAIGYHEQALIIARDIQDRRGEGSALGNLGIAYAALGQTEKAIGYYEQHLQIAREIQNRRGEGSALGNLGIAYADLGQTEKAIGYHEQALQIGQEIKDPEIVRVASAALTRLGRPPGPSEGC
jgi:tetratricopeptide (TPR) repeat protein